MPVLDAHRTIDAVWKLESARIVAALTRMVRDVGLAEELAQDALVAALEQWPDAGAPDNPGAWLTAVAKRRAVDHVRRSRRLTLQQEQLAHELEQQGDFEPGSPPAPEQDDLLRLIFISCHPVLPAEGRIALTLRLLGGLTAQEIARAFLVNEPTVARRIAAAKRTLAEERVPFTLPEGPELAGRLSSVLEVVYLIFNEGYSATSGDDLMRPGLCHEALRLGRLLAELVPDEAEVHGLLALMEIQESRSGARTGPAGEPVQLHEQNRGRWDQLRIRRGFTAMLTARRIGGTPGPYVLQAAVAVCHAQARTAAETDWEQIAALYESLVRLLPTPVVRLNRAVALGRARGPQAGLAVADALAADPALRDYHLLPSVRGDLLLGLGRREEARLEFQRAASLTGNAAERAFLHRRADGIGPAAGAVRTLGDATAEFLARGDLDTGTVRSYGQTLRRLGLALGERRPLATVTPEDVARTFTASWGAAAAATWNRHRSAVRSFGTWAGADDLADGLARRAGPGRRTEPLGPDQLAALWSRPGPAPRELALWRLLHESAAAVRVVLALNVEDLDLEDRRARAGDGWVSWRAGTARLLPGLLAGRSAGPLFLADRRPGPARTPGPADLCPHTGRGRLSYERAEHLFKRFTRELDPAGEGFTLGRLKPGS
ncbi:RNA polymerase sigma factor (sigma-70 family) [Kitasatospora herbaricolor]|uniref:sigma-70 family RNA polymerase sigma factor n=1 Tax=Kitasatospora herbaricolor TaxID=68217 RepID=UPI001E4EE150|nr:sigma-70 family RNA polymerase sigma factor [Kitasatospora herbaricolor]MDQ0309337.1 RNA polymerase sigma factor (sigma-70 family) [Kitasatospora herbaricolor]